jgi:hypothetical protein
MTLSVGQSHHRTSGGEATKSNQEVCNSNQLRFAIVLFQFFEPLA